MPCRSSLIRPPPRNQDQSKQTSQRLILGILNALDTAVPGWLIEIPDRRNRIRPSGIFLAMGDLPRKFYFIWAAR